MSNKTTTQKPMLEVCFTKDGKYQRLTCHEVMEGQSDTRNPEPTLVLSYGASKAVIVPTVCLCWVRVKAPTARRKRSTSLTAKPTSAGATQA